MKICCLLDYIPSYNTYYITVNKLKRLSLPNIDKSRPVERTDIVSNTSRSIYIRDTISYTNPDNFIFPDLNKELFPDSKIIVFKFNTDELIQDPHIWYEIISLKHYNTTHILHHPIAVRAVFEGTPDECMLWKLTHNSRWISYCDIQEHCYMVYEQ